MKEAAVYPPIGISSRRDRSSYGSPVFAQNRTYVESVTTASGAPVLIPLNLGEGALWAIYERLDGLLLVSAPSAHVSPQPGN